VCLCVCMCVCTFVYTVPSWYELTSYTKHPALRLGPYRRNMLRLLFWHSTSVKTLAHDVTRMLIDYSHAIHDTHLSAKAIPRASIRSRTGTERTPADLWRLSRVRGPRNYVPWQGHRRAVDIVDVPRST